MPTAPQKMWSSRQVEADGGGNFRTIVEQWRVYDAADEDAAIEAVRQVAPTEVAGLPLNSFRCDNRLNENNWIVEVAYEREDLGDSVNIDDGTEDTNPTISYGIRARGIIRRTAIVRMAVASLVNPAPKEIVGKRAIGLDEKGQAAGTEVDEPEVSFQLTFHHTRSKITAAYVKSVRAMVGRVNNTPFYGFEAGELKFNGMNTSFQSGQSGRIPVVYDFSFAPNEAEIQIAPGLILNNKRGWDYYWEYYLTTSEDTGTADETRAVQTLTAAVVDRVRIFDNFAKLEIGTG